MKSQVQQKKLNIEVILDYNIISSNLQKMVKKERNKHVWESSVLKPRKKRLSKQTKQQKAQAQQIRLSQSMQEQQINPQQSIPKQQNQVYDNNIQQYQKSNIDDSSESQSNQNNILDDSQSVDILKERLSIIKQVLLSDKDGQLESEHHQFIDYRPEQRQQILIFLQNRTEQKHLSQASNLMYIYGIPGSGKTFIIKNILSSHGWLSQTKWINCLTIMNKASLKKQNQYVELPIQQRKWLMVIDQFDQIESLLRDKKFNSEFRRYLQSILHNEFSDEQNKRKYIFISNRSYQQIDYEHISMVQQMIKCDKIVEVPFLPYKISCIINILKQRAMIINYKAGKSVFPSNFIELATRKICSTTQDIRKVINFIIRSYQNIGNNINWDSNELNNHLKISIFQTQHYQQETIETKIIKRMPEKPKNIFKFLLMLCEQASQENKPCLIAAIYRQGLKMEISHQSMDVMLREWEQQGLIRVQNYYQKQKERTHNLYQLKSIKTHLIYRECRHLFY